MLEQLNLFELFENKSKLESDHKEATSHEPDSLTSKSKSKSGSKKSKSKPKKSKSSKTLLIGNKKDKDKDDEDDLIEWSEEDIYELRYNLLYQALSVIRDCRRTMAQRKEAWDWFFEDDYSIPFSAANCAKYSGLDIVELRNLLLTLIPSL